MSVLADKHLTIIKATAAVVAENIEKITQTFYRGMFKNNPETVAFFNPAHQFNLQQPRALANSVVAYATALVVGGDSLKSLGPAVELIAQKHCALQIQPEHYSIVGSNLMRAIHEVLGAAITQEVHDAWEAAYLVLADILINREKQIYDEQEKTFGWRGFRPFVIKQICEEGDNVLSFHLYLRDADSETPLKQSFSNFKAGQYLTVKFPLSDAIAPRNYSISSPPGLPYYRISVKKVVPAGIVSTHMHTKLSVGTEVLVAPPCGEFFFQSAPGKNVVFISGGIGVTPFASMAESVAATNPLYWMHSSRGAVMPLRSSVPASAKLLHFVDTTQQGQRLTAQKIIDLVPHDSDFYVCGPREFIIDIVSVLKKQLPSAFIRYEFFGPLAKIQ